MENRITVVSIVTVCLTQFNEKLVRTKWFENESAGVMLLQSQTNHENKIKEFPQKKALAFLEFTRCFPIIKQLHGILSLSFLEWPDKVFLVSTKPGDIAWYLIPSYFDLTYIFYLVTDGDTIDIVNVLIAIISGGKRFSMISLRRERILSCYLAVWF